MPSANDLFTPAPREVVVKYGRYQLPRFTGFGPAEQAPLPRGYERATNFAKALSDTFGLTKWEKRMVAKGIATDDGLRALAAATPLDDAKTLDDITYRAKEAAGAGKGANLGTALHSFTEPIDRGEAIVVPAPWDQDIAAYVALRDAAGIEFFPYLMERVVVHAGLVVAGKFDRIGRLRRDLTVTVAGHERTLTAGTFVVADLKTGKDLTYSWPEISLQLALYRNADGMFNPDTWSWEELPIMDEMVALVIHLPVGKAEAKLHAVDIRAGWKVAAPLVAEVKTWRKGAGLATAVELDVPPITLAGAVSNLISGGISVTALTLKDRVQAAVSRAELSAIWRDAAAAGEWTPHLTALGQARMAEIGQS